MSEDVFENTQSKAAQQQERHAVQIKRSVAELMRTPHGRTFLRLINSGISSQLLCSLIMDFEENV